MRKAFTLIELLVVIAIIAVLAVVVVLTLNPGQLLAQSRDSTRLSDIATLQSALGLYLTDAGINGTPFVGSSSIIYVSIPDFAATTTAGTNCSTMGFPPLPSGVSYHCAASSTYRNVDGTGWIPINMRGISQGSPLGQLLIDPINTTSSGYFYEYAASSTQYDLAIGFEAAKNKGITGVAGLQNGRSWNSYEVGNNQTLIPLTFLEYKKDSSLMGYWPMDEGVGTTTQDFSGNINNSTAFTGSPTWQSSSSCKLYGCLNFNGTTDYVIIANSNSINVSNDFTVTVWVNIPSSNVGNGGILRKKANNGVGAAGYGWFLNDGFGAGKPYFTYSDGTTRTLVALPSAINDNTWHFLAATRTRGGTLFLYKDGGVVASTTDLSGIVVSSNEMDLGFGQTFFSGSMDDVRVYNRFLSSAEVQALYSGTR